MNLQPCSNDNNRRITCLDICIFAKSIFYSIISKKKKKKKKKKEEEEEEGECLEIKTILLLLF